MPKVRKRPPRSVGPQLAAPSTHVRSAIFAGIGAGFGAFLGSAIGRDPGAFVREYERFLQTAFDSGAFEQISSLMQQARATRTPTPEPIQTYYFEVVFREAKHVTPEMIEKIRIAISVAPSGIIRRPSSSGRESSVLIFGGFSSAEGHRERVLAIRKAVGRVPRGIVISTMLEE